MIFETLMIAGAVASAYGQYQAGNAAREAGEANAQALRRNAVLAKQEAVEDERRLRVMGRKTLGDMRAQYGASGITMEGSALEVLQESAATIELDALTIRHRGDTGVRSMQDDAESELRRGEGAQSGSRLSATGTLLSGGAQAYGMKRT